jgi:hypothetical protein
MKVRIIKKDGLYFPQRKILFWWKYYTKSVSSLAGLICEDIFFTTENEAKSFILTYYKEKSESKKKTVYLEFDI